MHGVVKGQAIEDDIRQRDILIIYKAHGVVVHHLVLQELWHFLVLAKKRIVDPACLCNA